MKYIIRSNNFEYISVLFIWCFN